MEASTALTEYLNSIGCTVKVVELDACELAQRNARYMPDSVMNNLVENLSGDGGLQSVPLAYERDGRYVILSGNHRIMAARKAGLDKVLLLVRQPPESRSEEVAIQLSHNAIVGYDDPSTLVDLWGELDDVFDKAYSGLADTLDKIDEVDISALPSINIAWRHIGLLFLPEEERKLNRIMERLQSALADDVVYIAPDSLYDDFIERLHSIKKGQDIINTATAFRIFMEIVERHLDEVPEVIASWHDDAS